MGKPFKTRLIDTLKSDKYIQVKFRLKNEEGKRCVMGVILDMLNIPVKEEKSPATWNELEKRTGISMTDLSRITRMNDAGISFEQIAQYLEAGKEPT